MSTSNLTTIALVLEGILHLVIVGVIVKRQSLKERAVLLLFLYVVLAFLWALNQILSQLGWLAFLPEGIVRRVPLYGVFLLSFLFFHLSRSFLRLTGKEWPLWAAGGVWAAVLIFLDVNPLAFPQVLVGSLQLVHVTFSLLLLGWAALLVGATVLTVKTYRQTVQPLHRNRITYWPSALALMIVGGALFFARQEALGSALYLLATPIAVYVALTLRLPDIRQTTRQVLSYLLVTIAVVVLYAVSFVVVEYLFRNVDGYRSVISGSVIALILAFCFRPLLGWIRQLVNRLIAQRGYDPAHIVREYSTRISNILDLERLAEMIVSVIGEAMEVRDGLLFLVQPPEEGGEAGDDFRLRSVRGQAGEESISGTLAVDSPIVRYLRQEHRPLAQYEADLLPQFQQISSEERAWLSGLGMDVYVPIYTKEEWSGLLALGPKASGDRYFDEDLSLLSTLADQTAVALENARLVEDLVRLNLNLKRAYIALEQTYNELEQAYSDLDQAKVDLELTHRQLQEVDRLKSAFIGVVTHELRSPFANLNFSVQLLERYGLEKWLVEQREQLEQLKEGIETAKGMVDTLVTFATFLSKQGELQLDWLNFGGVVENTIVPLETLAQGKGVILTVEVAETLPQLHGDRDRLSDAVYHLVQNALKFTDSGGTVAIRCRAEAGEMHFEVQDTGVGVPEDRLPTLWDAFTQMADPLRRGVEGLGLGLALVRYIILAHGGQVWAESAVGVGSTFGFRVPMNGKRAAPTFALAGGEEREAVETAEERVPQLEAAAEGFPELEMAESDGAAGSEFAAFLESSAEEDEPGSPESAPGSPGVEIEADLLDNRFAAFLASPDEEDEPEPSESAPDSPEVKAEVDLLGSRFAAFLQVDEPASSESVPDTAEPEVKEGRKGLFGGRLAFLKKLGKRKKPEPSETSE